MTVEERFERMDRVMAGLVEERRKDREEFRQLWRDNQRQINELGIRITEVDEPLGQRIEQLAEESRAADKRLEARIDQLGGRIDSLISAIGHWRL